MPDFLLTPPGFVDAVSLARPLRDIDLYFLAVRFSVHDAAALAAAHRLDFRLVANGMRLTFVSLERPILLNAANCPVLPESIIVGASVRLRFRAVPLSHGLPDAPEMIAVQSILTLSNVAIFPPLEAILG